MGKLNQLVLLFVVVWISLAGCARPYGAAHHSGGIDRQLAWWSFLDISPLA